MQTPTAPHRQVLIRCSVINRDTVCSVRFVEHEHFRLWQYMMANKHDLIVQDTAVSLWLPESEYASNASVFDRAGACEGVTRLTFGVYDRATGLCNTLQRFVPVHETEQVRDLLLRRIPPDLRDSDDFLMEQQRGYAIIKAGTDAGQIGLPLEF